MTEQQRKAIEILNSIKEQKHIDGSGNRVSVISEDDYFFLLSFIIDKQETVVYPWTQPYMPWTSPIVTYETTCSTGEQQ